MKTIRRTKLSLGDRALRNVAVKVWSEVNCLPKDCVVCGLMIEKIGTQKGCGNIHHISGDIRDNRLENLQLVCVTCHHSRHHLGVAKPAQGIAARKRWKGTVKSAEHKEKLRQRANRQHSNEEEYLRAYAARWPGKDPLIAWKRRQRKLALKGAPG